MPDLKLTVVSPVETVMENEPIEFFRVILANGYPLSIYPNHAPLIAMLGHKTAQYRQDGNEKLLQIAGGVLRIFQNKIICVIEKTGLVDEVKNA